MATPKKPVPVLDAKAERDANMRRAYQQAEAALKANHADEWNALLTQAYTDNGVTDVRRRLTDDERAAREQEKVEARKARLLAQLEALGGAPVATPLVAVPDLADPFSA